MRTIHLLPFGKVNIRHAFPTILAVLFCINAAIVQGSPERINCFVIGSVDPTRCPFTGFFIQDPLFKYSVEPVPVDMGDREKRKIDRIYFPRTRNALVESYQFFVFSDARIQHYTSRQFRDIDYAFREAGIPSLSSFGPGWIHAFEPTIMYDLMPISEYDFYFHQSWKVRFVRNRNPVFLPFIDLGMEKVTGDAYAKMKPRQGAKIWAYMQPVDFPWLVSWEPYGSNPGLTWVCGDEFNRQWWSTTPNSRGENPYAIDMATNLILYSLGRPMITDIHARREARSLIYSFQKEKSLVLSMMDWAYRFGANTVTLSEKLGDLEGDVTRATAYYLQQDYATSVDTMDSLSNQVAEITSDAVALKDEAMFWVYVSEWLAITSAAIMSGTILWTLMIRRRAYREVSSTRLEI